MNVYESYYLDECVPAMTEASNAIDEFVAAYDSTHTDYHLDTTRIIAAKQRLLQIISGKQSDLPHPNSVTDKFTVKMVRNLPYRAP